MTQTYRNAQPSAIHLGNTEHTINPGQIFGFDGLCVTFEDGTKIKLPSPQSLRTAISRGWIVPEGSEVAPSQTVPAVESRNPVFATIVQDEERDLGSIGAVRHQAAERQTSEKARAQNVGGKPHPVVARDSVYRVVSHLKTPAQQDPLLLDSHQSQTLSKGTSDYIERGSSENFTNDGVAVNSTGSSMGGAETAKVVKTLGMPPHQKERVPPTDSVSAIRQYIETGRTWDGLPMDEATIRRLGKVLLRKFDASVSQASVVREMVDAAQPTLIQDGDLDWDMSLHWKTRQTIVRRDFSGDLENLRKILAIEDSKGVIKEVQRCLSELSLPVDEQAPQ